MPNVQDGYLDLAEIKSIYVKEKDVGRFSLQEGDLLLTEGGDFDKLGRGYVWHNEIQNCLHQNHIFAVRADKKSLLPMFLSLITRSKYGKQYFLSCAKKTSIVFQIINFPAPWRNELASDGKILTHFLHNADNFTRIFHIRFECLYD